jgi:uncharacterized protein
MADFLSKEFTYAVVGASNNPEKYGYKVLKSLSESGYRVIPINPREKEILGLKVYKSISEMEFIDVVIFVVPPNVTLEILPDCVKKKITKVWLQPGSESNEIFDFCMKNKIEFFFGCMLLQNK